MSGEASAKEIPRPESSAWPTLMAEAAELTLRERVH